MDRLRENPGPNSSSKSLMQYLASIQTEMQRPEYTGGTQHGVRAAFVRAEEDDSVARASPAIRLSHLRWEIGLLEKQKLEPDTSSKKNDKRLEKASANARNALHSALAACPWLKDLYLTALSSPILCSALTPSGTRAVYNTMLDRGIRIRVDISDHLDAPNA